MYKTIGYCSECGGHVKVYDGPWHGVEPPVPSCSSCGAVEDLNLPVIKMKPKARYPLMVSTDGIWRVISYR